MPAPTNCPATTARRRRRVVPATVAALLVAGLVAGCGTPDDQFAPACPGLSLVPGAGSITRFAGPSHDPAAMIIQAQITAVPARCVRDGPSSVKSTLHVEADVARGVAAQGTISPVPYFIAVSKGDKVLQEQEFFLAPQFPSNSDRTTLKGDDIELLVPVSRTKSAAAFHIYVGFRLTRDDLTYNQTHHPE